jgi:hypothetical protein
MAKGRRTVDLFGKIENLERLSLEYSERLLGREEVSGVDCPKILKKAEILGEKGI